MKAFFDKILAGAKGSLIRAVAPTLIGYAVARFNQNEWYIAAGPLLALVSKWAHRVWPNSTLINLLPF